MFLKGLPIYMCSMDVSLSLTVANKQLSLRPNMKSKAVCKLNAAATATTTLKLNRPTCKKVVHITAFCSPFFFRCQTDIILPHLLCYGRIAITVFPIVSDAIAI